MSTALSSTQLDAINQMPAEQRYDYFIKQLLELKQVWGLSSDTGWLVLPDGEEEQLPVWPHAELAALWAAGDFPDCQPQAISLEDWLNKWLPGMEKDDLLAAVCPGTDGDSIILSAAELLGDIHEANGESD